MRYRLPEPYYFEQGSIGIVLLHAYTGSANDVRMLGRSLEKQNWSVLAPNFAGHATFEPLDILNGGNVTLWWQTTVTAIQQLSKAHKKPIFVFGLSLGGLFALRALELLPEVVGGGVFSTPLLEGVPASLTPLFQQYAQKVYQATAVSEALQMAKLAQIRQQLPQQLAQIQQFGQLVQTDLNQIGPKPVFIGQGGHDQVIDPNQAKQLQQRLTDLGSPVDYHWYAEAGHVITVDTAHHQLEADVTAFIKRFENKKEVLI
ncbi:alpha/beta hydrolase [Latilactobacillus fuchuensis]|uniref:alpha/beta hydrolase n=1 Tax=Latilactobacillus fuchuensis TaxID=164393 RepID=UPI0039B0FEEC